MSAASKITVTVLLVVFLTGLGIADAVYSGKKTALVGENGPDTIAIQGTGEDEDDTEPTAEESDEDEDTQPTPAATRGVAKNNGAMPAQVAAQQGLSLQETTGKENAILPGLIAGAVPVYSSAILADGDRAGSVTWTQTPQAKIYFVSLKESLLSAFSKDVKDLEDRTEQEPGKPVRNVLQFQDPALGEEKIVFVRVRERILEFHLTPGKEEVMQRLIDGLSA